MASAYGLEAEQKCAICIDYPTEPRKLPGCSHSFCTNCILTFVLKLQKDSSLGNEFQCPVCKIATQIPEGTIVSLEWVRTMEFDNTCSIPDIKTPKSEVLKPENGFEFCHQCGYLNKATKTDIYCSTCHKCFCSKCSEIFHAFEMTADHCLIKLEMVRSELFFEEALKLLDRFIMCGDHPDKPVVFYCGNHSKMFCVMCLGDNHKNCKNVKHISSMNMQSGNSSETTGTSSVSKLSMVIKKLQRHIGSVIDMIKENDTENKKSLETIQTEIQETKQKVVRVLDAMEDELNQTGKAMVKEIAIKNLESIQELNGTVNNLKVFEVLMDKIATVVKPEQAYVCVHEANNAVNEVKQKIAGTWSSFTKHGIQLKKEGSLELNVVQNLGVNETSKLASLQHTVTNVPLPAYHDNEPEMKKIGITKSGVYDIVPEGVDKYKDPEPTYNDLVFLENGYFLITDSFNGTCSMLDGNMNIVGSYQPAFNDEHADEDDSFKNLLYASYTKNGTFAISIPSAMIIKFVTANECLAYSSEIVCNHKPMAIHVLNNKDLAIAWDEPVAFGILTGMMWSCEEIYFTMDKSGRKLKSFEYIAVDEIRCHVIQPCQVDKAVYCFSFSGQPVFQYSSKDLKRPRGVALDNNQNIYICENALNTIHILSPTGQVMMKIKDSCPLHPLAIQFERNGKRFAVTHTSVSNWWSVHFFSITTEGNEHLDSLEHKD